MKTIRIKFLIFVYFVLLITVVSFIFSYGAVVSMGKVNEDYNTLYKAQKELRVYFENNVRNVTVLFDRVSRLVDLLNSLNDKLDYAIEKNLISIEVRSIYKKELDKYNEYFNTLINILTKGVKSNGL